MTRKYFTEMADIFIESFNEGVIDKQGLDYLVTEFIHLLKWANPRFDTTKFLNYIDERIKKEEK